MSVKHIAKLGNLLANFVDTLGIYAGRNDRLDVLLARIVRELSDDDDNLNVRRRALDRIFSDEAFLEPALLSAGLNDQPCW